MWQAGYRTVPKALCNRPARGPQAARWVEPSFERTLRSVTVSVDWLSKTRCATLKFSVMPGPPHCRSTWLYSRIYGKVISLLESRQVFSIVYDGSASLGRNNRRAAYHRRNRIIYSRRQSHRRTLTKRRPKLDGTCCQPRKHFLTPPIRAVAHEFGICPSYSLSPPSVFAPWPSNRQST